MDVIVQLHWRSFNSDWHECILSGIDCDNAFSELQGEINQTFECPPPITQNNCTDTVIV